MASGIKLENWDDFLKKLGQAPANFERLSDKAIAKTTYQIQARVISGINSQRWAGKWKKLSPKYLAQKARQGGSEKILIGGIRKSAKNMLPGNYRNSFAVEKIQMGTWIVGSNYPQARSLEFGSDKTNMPARSHLKFAVEESKDDFFENVLNALKESFQ